MVRKLKNNPFIKFLDYIFFKTAWSSPAGIRAYPSGADRIAGIVIGIAALLIVFSSGLRNFILHQLLGSLTGIFIFALFFMLLGFFMFKLSTSKPLKIIGVYILIFDFMATFLLLFITLLRNYVPSA